MAAYARMAWPWGALGFVALVPWLAVLDRARSPRRALGAALLMAVAFVLAVFGWFASAVQTYTGLPWALCLAALAVLAPIIQPQLVPFALARHLARRRGAGLARTVLVGASVWVGTEWASGKLFGDTLGHGLYASAWMRQAADLGGVYGLTFVLIAANECLGAALAAARRPRRALAPAACMAALVLGLLAYGAVRVRQLAPPEPSGGGVTAGLVQAGISRYDRLAAFLGTYDAVRHILDVHFALSAEALARAKLDLLVWPETVYPTTFGAPKSADGAAFDREIAAFVARIGRPLIFGAYEAADGAEFNAAFFLPPPVDGRVDFATYRKASLFPLTERVPAFLESEAVRRRLPWLGTWKPGDGARVVPLALPDGRVLRVAPLICYDVLDPTLALSAVRRGADLIVTLSNDSWFAGGAGPRLHLVGAAFRSIETRRPQLRATNTGISAVITATGALAARAGEDERAVLVAPVAVHGGAGSLLLAWGDWFGPAALAAAALLTLSLLPARVVRGRGRP